jgi:hypothetical protein
VLEDEVDGPNVGAIPTHKYYYKHIQRREVLEVPC